MDLTELPLPAGTETVTLEGTYAPKDLRAFAALLARRVAGTKLWALAAFILMPLYWAGNLRKTWPLMVPVAIVLLGFVLLLRFVILPAKLYKAAIRLPGVFDPRRITLDGERLVSASDAGRLTVRLEDVQEVVAAADHLFVMVTPKQGVPIPKAWIGGPDRVERLTRQLLARKPELKRA